MISSSTISTDDIHAFTERVLSSEADTLFAGNDPSCAAPRPPPPLEQISITRTIGFADAVGERTQDETISVGECTSGIANELRQRLGFLRTLAGL